MSQLRRLSAKIENSIHHTAQAIHMFDEYLIARYY